MHISLMLRKLSVSNFAKAIGMDFITLFIEEQAVVAVFGATILSRQCSVSGLVLLW